MKKETKKAEVKKIVAKTISKPQTVELAGMNAISVTLTEGRKLVIKYVKYVK